MLTLKASGGSVDAVRFTPDGRGLFAFRSTSRGGRNFEHWPDWSAGLGAVRVALPGDATAEELSPDGRHLLGLANGLFVVHDRAAGTFAAADAGPQGGSVSLARFTPDGRRLITAHGDDRTHHLTCRAVAAPHAVAWSVPTSDPVAGVVFLDAGRFVAFEMDPDYVPHWVAVRDGATGGLLARHAVAYFLRGVVASPDRRLIVGHHAANLVVLRPDDLAARPVVVTGGSRKRFTGVAFHPSGGYLAAVSNDNTVRLTDTATWQVFRTLDWDIGRLRSVAFSPDGAVCAAGGDSGRVVVWDIDG